MWVLPLLLLVGFAIPVHAQSATWHGYIDFRAAAPGDERPWTDGGLGKMRFGDGTDTAIGAALAGTFQLTPAWSASTDVQYASDQRHRLDVLDASIRYRPVSTTPWRWSARVGAFFPPISVENDNVGWTSPWTLSPSAINTWVGEELRTFGAEVRLERHAETHTLEFTGGLFGKNDPAGELLAARGWAMGDFTSGFAASLREPDAYAPLTGTPAPAVFRPFVEIDHRIGWYAGASVRAPAYGELSLLRYDNRADPTREQEQAGREVYAWHTRFWSLGAQRQFGDVMLASQAMHGTTAFEPQPGFLLETQFNAGYVLAAWELGRWQPALRWDAFQLMQLPDTLVAPLSEHGNAATVALNWRPRDAVRITGEWMRVDSTRNQRLLEGASPHRVDTQLQVSVRLQF
jgi:hypothetical protein